MSWLINRVPESKRALVIELFNNQDMAAIYEIFSEHLVIPAGACGTCKRNYLVSLWAAEAINTWTNGLEKTRPPQARDSDIEIGEDAGG